MPDLQHAFDIARAAARAGADVAMQHFRKLRDSEIARKADNSLVTIADREAEQAIIEVIQRAFPDHAILGEEGGDASPPGPEGERQRPRWIIDPIDGTRAFASGGDYWGPLVALQDESGAVDVGVAILPAIGREYAAACGLGCYRDDLQITLESARPVPAAWSDAVLAMGSLPRLFAGAARSAVIELAGACAYAYAGCDLGGCLLLLDGVADAWIETGVKIWDIAALKVLIEEADGVFTDFAGGDDLTKGEAIAGSPWAHTHVRSVMQS